MKPIHIAILVLALGLLVFAWFYNRKQKAAVEKAQQDRLINGVTAIMSITTVVDPTTNQEFVISEFGENNLDGGVETRKMKVALATVINDINSRAAAPGSIKTLKLRMYDVKMNLLSSTTIINPYQQQLPIAVPAMATQTGTGITYTCANNAVPSGPGFYNNGAGNLFFGMFCN